MYRILLAEDNPADVYLIKEALSQGGKEFDLKVVTDGEQALRIIESEATPFDLVILDLNMPKIDGAEVLKILRAQQEWVNVPVAIFTSSSAPEDRHSVNGFKGTVYLTKPTDLEAFLGMGTAFINLIAPRGKESSA